MTDSGADRGGSILYQSEDAAATKALRRLALFVVPIAYGGAVALVYRYWGALVTSAAFPAALAWMGVALLIFMGFLPLWLVLFPDQPHAISKEAILVFRATRLPRRPPKAHPFSDLQRLEVWAERSYLRCRGTNKDGSQFWVALWDPDGAARSLLEAISHERGFTLASQQPAQPKS